MDTSRVEAASSASTDQIARRLSEAFGSECVELVVGNHFRLADEEARVVVLPRGIDELAEMLKLVSTERWRVIPAGAGTWLEMGNRPAQAQLIVSTARMKRVLEYEPADLTATVEAGCTLADFNARAAEQRQWIPLDSFGAAAATLGAITASASYGPLRCAYGTPRDWVIGMRTALADGRIAKAGGKVVKNVAGYDLCKLHTGAFGTLGIIGELSFKLRAVPPSDRTMVFYAADAFALCELVARIIDSDVQPAALELLAPSAVSPLETGACALVLRLLNEAETVAAQADEAAQVGADFKHTTLGENDAAQFWRAYHETETAAHWAFSLRLSVLPAELAALLEDVEQILPPTVWRAHAANGVLRLLAEADRLTAESIAELRRTVQGYGGQLVVLRAPAALKDQLDAWGEVGQAAALMRGLKQKFDPLGLLNPGRFVAGI